MGNGKKRIYAEKDSVPRFVNFTGQGVVRKGMVQPGSDVVVQRRIGDLILERNVPYHGEFVTGRYHAVVMRTKGNDEVYLRIGNPV